MTHIIWKNLEQVEHYARIRYRTVDQWWVNNREMHLVNRLFKKYQLKGTILDVPCGFGRFNKLLNNYGTVYAADLNHFAVLYYNKKVCSKLPAIEASAEDLPFNDNNFTGVFCFRLLQHIHNSKERIAILKEFNRVSSNWLVVSFYVSSWLHHIQRSILKMPAKITMITKSQLMQEAQTAGLRLHSMHSILPGFHAHRICLFYKLSPL